MGFLNDDTDEQLANSNRLVDDQINADKALLETKKNALIKTRLDLVKNQGKEQWTPDVPSTAGKPSPNNDKGFGSLF